MALTAYDKLKHSIRYFLLRRLPPCQQVVEQISQSMERKLTHLWICAWCQWYLEHLHLIHDLAHTHDPGLTDGPTLSPEARERIKRATDLHR
jgi:hypothetical protein